MLVNQILSLKGAGASNIITIVSTATVEDAAKLLAEKRIGAIVVSDDGKKPVGILSERDVVRELGRRGAGGQPAGAQPRIVRVKLLHCFCFHS